MHINALFICSLVPRSTYHRYDEKGEEVAVPIYLATASLLPLAFAIEDVEARGTWWHLTDEFTESTFSLLYAQARAAGVSTCILSHEHKAYIDALAAADKTDMEVVYVVASNRALLDTAREWRTQCLVPIIAVTGSIGKTTTLDMLDAIFSVDRLPVLIARGGNHSLTYIAGQVLHITEKHVAALFEVDGESPGDVQAAAELLRPTIALITSVCPAHLDGIGDLRVVAKEKQDIFSYFSPSQIGIVCGDYQALVSHAYDHPIVRFGLKNKNSVTARKVTIFKDDAGILKTKVVFRIYDYEREIILPGHHKALVYGALAAGTLAHFLYVPFDIIVKGVSRYVPMDGQFDMRMLRGGRGILINDNHSISPESVKAALHAIHAFDKPARKIAVLGNIPALGGKESFWHRHVGRELVKTRSISDLILVGSATRLIRQVAPSTMDVQLAGEWSDARNALHELLQPSGNIVLVSGAAPQQMNRLISDFI